jgi:hypothetical protein
LRSCIIFFLHVFFVSLTFVCSTYCCNTTFEICSFGVVLWIGFANARSNQAQQERSWAPQIAFFKLCTIFFQFDVEQFDYSFVLDVLCIQTFGELKAWWLHQGHSDHMVLTSFYDIVWWLQLNWTFSCEQKICATFDIKVEVHDKEKNTKF